MRLHQFPRDLAQNIHPIYRLAHQRGFETADGTLDEQNLSDYGLVLPYLRDHEAVQPLANQSGWSEQIEACPMVASIRIFFPVTAQSSQNVDFGSTEYFTAISGVSTGTWPRCKDSTPARVIPEVSKLRSMG